MIKQILLVGLGGSIGSVARYLCQRMALSIYPHSFPWGTFAVNFTGCFLIGWFWGKAITGHEDWRLFLMTGLCGGFTTFSAFTLESISLLKDNKTGLFFLYAAGSLIACLLATYAGIRMTR
jgi:CrcB protein